MEIIGIGGYSKSGKNLFATLASKILSKQYNKSSICIALADEIKDNISDMINVSRKQNNVTYLVESQSSKIINNSKNKEIYRPILIAYGNLMRTLTDTQYWTSILENKINSLNGKYDIVFIPDIRYNTSKHDECGWLLNKMGGKLIHLKKYNTINKKKKYIEPPNNFERLNDPLVKHAATICCEWREIKAKTLKSRYNSKYLNNIVLDILQKLKIV